ncbi:MAG: hypothetical protein WAZ77_22060 [Candidatus Nitrosopolaris sp.]|jgi:hypothetical protein
MPRDPIQLEVINNIILSYSLNVGDFVSSDFLSIKKIFGGGLYDY